VLNPPNPATPGPLPTQLQCGGPCSRVGRQTFSGGFLLVDTFGEGESGSAFAAPFPSPFFTTIGNVHFATVCPPSGHFFSSVGQRILNELPPRNAPDLQAPFRLSPFFFLRDTASETKFNRLIEKPQQLKFSALPVQVINGPFCGCELFSPKAHTVAEVAIYQVSQPVPPIPIRFNFPAHQTLGTPPLSPFCCTVKPTRLCPALYTTYRRFLFIHVGV